MIERNIELDERVISAMVQENTGNPYKRQHYISGIAFDAKAEAAMKPFDRCQFSNKYGLCKLEIGHPGSHTVISLGSDE